MVSFKLAKMHDNFAQISELADNIWSAHYIEIIGISQVNYMLQKFQSVKAIEKQIRAGLAYFVLVFEESPVGYIAIEKKPDTLFISKFYVLSDYRRKNIGRTAMQFIENEARKHKLNTIRLTVNINNLNAIKVYNKLGFKNIGSVVTDIGNGFVMDDFLMNKTI